MHTPKFNIGDIVAMDPNDPYSFTVIDIVFGEKEGKWNFYSIKKVKDSYVVIDDQDGASCCMPFHEESIFHLIHRPNNKPLTLIQIQVNLCPRCHSVLKKKYSYYAGCDIDKCSNPNCGWC